MAKEFAKKFYRSKAWRECRAAFISSKLGLCERCRNPGYIVHHKERLSSENINNPDVTLNWDRLMYLCTECHNAIYNNSPTRPELGFNDCGDIVKVKNVTPPPGLPVKTAMRGDRTGTFK